MARTAAEISTLLGLVDSAITALVTGQIVSASVGGRTWSKLDLPTLQTFRNQLETELRAVNSTNRPAVATFRGPG